MKRKSILKRIFIISIFVVFTAGAVFAQTTAFNFQGRLNDGANPANGNVEMQFKLYSALSGGTQIGATILKPNVIVINGIFSTQLDFGAAAFDGSARFVEIGVRPAGNTNSFTTLTPRQSILSTPYAIQAKNAQQLGGLDASQYVTTTTGGNSFIKNSATLQTGNFNISGDGLVGGNFGVGITAPTTKLDVNGGALFRVAGTGGSVQIGTPNSESGIAMFNTNRADIRFDNGALRLLVGTGTTSPSSLNGITINTLGNVGIGSGNPGPSSRLYVLSQANSVISILGESQSGIGVVGKSITNYGVYGISDNAEGVYGKSFVKSGVFGETSVSSLTAAGVYGLGTGSGSIGVIGEANVNNAVGVFGVSTSPTGVAVYARNNSGGRAIYAEGNVAQQLNSGGLVKALIYVNQNATVNRCYNSQTNSNTGNCGFTISQPTAGFYDVNFGFPVDGRFITVTPLSNAGSGGCFGGSASIDPPTGNFVRVYTNCSSGSFSKPFMIMVY